MNRGHAANHQLCNKNSVPYTGTVLFRQFKHLRRMRGNRQGKFLLSS